MTGSLTISATYATKVDTTTLFLAIAALLSIGVIYLITQREYNRRKNRARW